jgi:ribonuclease-3
LRNLGISYKDIELINLAFIHPSYSNEFLTTKVHNERLEFLGDAVLSLITVEFLYKTYPKMHEGNLSKRKSLLVSESILASICKEIKLNKLLLIGKGEEATGGRERESTLANLLEAFLGALYLDQGLDFAKIWFLPYLEKKLKKFSEIQESKDVKTLLQEFSQKKYKIVPSYKLVQESGKEHEKIFRVEVSLLNWKAEGKGKNKKEAEKEAARILLQKLKITKKTRK